MSVTRQEAGWRLLETPMTRKQFLVLGGLATLALLGGLQWGTSIDDGVQAEEISNFTIYPGWLENNTRAPFIDSNLENKGHFNWMRETIFTSPLLMDLTTDYFKYLNQALEKKQRLRLGDMVGHAYSSARNKIKEKYGESTDPRTSLNLEAMHVGLFAFTAAATAWFNEGDIKAFGVDLKGKKVVEYYWDENGLGRVVFPTLFVNYEHDISEKLSNKEGLPDRVNGQDRTLHFANHLLLIFNYLYSDYFNLKTHKRMPTLLKTVVNWCGGNSVYDRGRVLSWLAGRAYELKALLDPESWPFPFVRGREDIPDGPFDFRVENDFEGNELGAETAIALIKALTGTENDTQINKILEELNNPKFLDGGTEPKLSGF